MDEFYVKLGIAFFGAVGVFLLMLRSQRRKERDADHQYKMTLKSRGLVDHIQEDVHPNVKCYDPFLHKEVSKSELRRVAIMAQERLDLPDIKCPVVEHAETVLARKEEKIITKKKKKSIKRKVRRSKNKGKKS